MEKEQLVIGKNYNQLFFFRIRQNRKPVLLFPCKQIGIVKMIQINSDKV